MTDSIEHPLVELRRVTKTYGAGRGRVTALAEASIKVYPGEFVAVVGRSGSGKSTLMNLIGLLDPPCHGDVFLDGIHASALDFRRQAELRNRHIGFIFQAYHLLARRTALANVALPLAYRGVGRRERHSRSSAALACVGLGDRETSLPGEMSGGEQQRVAIARALVTDPDLIIADEPTGALDSASANLVLHYLEAACAAGRTVVMVTHDAGIAARANRQICMSDGRLVVDPVPTAMPKANWPDRKFMLEEVA